MPRRRAPEPAPLPSTVVPAEIVVGAVVGVWGPDLLSAQRRYHAGRRQWEAEEGLDRAASHRLVQVADPSRASLPWRDYTRSGSRSTSTGCGFGREERLSR